MLRRDRHTLCNVFLVLLLGCVGAFGQEHKSSFGPVLGFYKPQITGRSNIGDVYVVTDPTIPNNEPFIGLFYSYTLNSWLQLSNETLFSQHFYGLTVYNQMEQCTSCPVKKGSVMGMNVLEFLPNAKITVIRIGEFKGSLYGGVSAQLRFRQSPPSNVSFGNQHPGVAEVINQLEEGYKPIVGFMNFGVTADYGRIFLQMRFHHMMGLTFAKNILLDGTSYPMHLQNRYFTFSTGYHFYSLRSKKKKAKG